MATKRSSIPAAAATKKPTRTAEEERYEALLSVVPIGVAQLSIDRCIQYVNDRLCDILGHPRSDLVGKRLKDFSHPEDNEVTETAVSELIDSPASTSIRNSTPSRPT